MLITIDVDWAEDKEIFATHNMLLKANCRATWFCTHISPIIEEITNCDLYEIGIHPNLMQDSTQGKTYDEVLEYLLGLFPNAKSMRTHRLYWSSPFAKSAIEHGILYDVSLFLPLDRVWHVKYPFGKLIRLSYSWGDNYPSSDPRGHKIFDFHPVHIVNNSIVGNIFNELINSKCKKLWISEL